MFRFPAPPEPPTKALLRVLAWQPAMSSITLHGRTYLRSIHVKAPLSREPHCAPDMSCVLRFLTPWITLVKIAGFAPSIYPYASLIGSSSPWSLLDLFSASPPIVPLSSRTRYVGSSGLVCLVDTHDFLVTSLYAMLSYPFGSARERE